MIDSNLTALFATICTLGLTLVFKESIKALINRFFTSLSKRQSNIVFFSILILATLGAFPLGKMLINNDQKGHPNNEVANMSSDINTSRTNREIASDATQFLLEKAKRSLEQRHTRDSILMANRPQKWVFQIGPPLTELSEVFNKCRNLRDFGDTYVFKVSRKTYLVLIDIGPKEKEDLINMLDDLKSQIHAFQKDITIIDLLRYCSKMEGIRKGSNIQDKHQDIELPCYECAKL